MKNLNKRITAALLLLAFIGGGELLADDNGNNNVIIPVIVIKEKPTEIPRVPSLGVTLNCRKSGNTFSIDNNSGIEFNNVEIEQLTSPYCYWSGTFGNGASCEINFNGNVGDYKLILSGCECTYVGYFTLE